MSHNDSFDISRRRVLAGIAGSAAGASLLAACASSEAPAESGLPEDYVPAQHPPAGKTLPKPEDSGIEHIVVVMMENRSFDHMLGWVPGANGRQAGLRFPNVEGKSIETFRLSSDADYGYQSCGWADPDHGYNGGRVHLNNGKLDGWLLTDDTKLNPADKFPVGYFTGEDLPFYKGMAESWTVCDQYYHGILSSTYPNRIYMHSGETDRLSNSFDRCALPTIWDRLAAKGVSGSYYFQDLPLTALWYEQHLNVSLPYATFLLQASLGLLPAVSYVEPRFLGENPQGISNDDHPVADVRDGQAFLNQVYEALRNSPSWDKTLLIINYDEWGGFFDHVVPPMAPLSEAEKALGNDGRLGFRVPCLMAGPRVPKGVSSLPFDPQSILNLITWRFGLDPIGPRADWSLNLAYALDFDNPPRSDKPAFDVPAGPHGRLCTTGTPLDTVLGVSSAKTMETRAAESHYGEWLVLREIARRYGFPEPSANGG